MKKTHWPARLAAGCLVTLTLVGVAFAAGQQGSQSDPLVTLSYLTQKATPSILSQVDSKLTARETELVSNKKSREELGLTYTPLHEGMSRTFRAFSRVYGK